MEKIRLWFIYKPVIMNGKLSEITKKVINLVNKIEEFFDKEIFDLRSIDYSRFLSESKIKLNKDRLPIVLINDKVVFTKKLPSVEELNQKIIRLRQKGAK